MRKEEVVGSKKKMQYQNLDTDPDPNPDTGGGVGGRSAKNVLPPLAKS
jgi:hypothetical protein